MKARFYLHFETKPTYAELEKLFQKCEEYEPVLGTSYLISVHLDDFHEPFRDIVRDCFPHSRFVLAKVSNFYEYTECPYIKVTWGQTH